MAKISARGHHKVAEAYVDTVSTYGACWRVFFVLRSDRKVLVASARTDEGLPAYERRRGHYRILGEVAPESALDQATIDRVARRQAKRMATAKGMNSVVHNGEQFVTTKGGDDGR